MSESSITIGPYAIESELGAGGMGTVYQCVHVETSELVAVKVLSAAMAREPGLVERFRREIESLKKLTNPHIVHFLDSGEHEGTYYYAMELVEGETLTARLGRVKRLGWESVIEMSVQVCRALKAAHDAGIIHRDLKPGNLMLTSDDVVKLTDFGVAQIFAAGKLTATGGIVGTAEYMSPEQAEGRKAHPSSDLYSLGAVMYCMLTGRPPFVGRSAVEIIQKQRYGQFDPPRSIVPEMPRWLDDVVCRLMSKEPGDRFPNAYVLGLRLQEIPRKVTLSQGEEQGEDQGQTEVQQSESEPDIDEATSVYRIAEGGTGRDAEAGDELTEAGDELTEAGDELTMPFTAVTADARPRGGGEAGANAGDGGPGEATLARDMMKFEIERQSQRSRFGRWWNSTPGLLVGLVVLVSTGLLLWRMSGMSAEDRFAEGVRLLELSEPDWQTARDRYFTPLVTEDPARWRERVSPHLERIERMAVESESRPTRRLKAGDATEVTRFLRLAREYERLGDRSRATRILESVLGLIDGQAKWESEAGVARALLDEWRGDSVSTDGEGTLLSEALSRAKRARAGGRIQEARRVWQSIVELYAGDTSAEAGVVEARRGLVETEERR